MTTSPTGSLKIPDHRTVAHQGQFLSSPATPPSRTKARASTPNRSARNSASATCSKARSSATRIQRADQCATRVDGAEIRRASVGRPIWRRTWPIFSSCKTKSWRGWPTPWAYELVRGGSREVPLQKPRRHRSHYARLGAGNTKTAHDPIGTRSMQRGPCSNRRSGSTRTTHDALAGEAECYGLERFYFANADTDYEAKVIGQADPGHRPHPTPCGRMGRRVFYLSEIAPFCRVSAHCRRRTRHQSEFCPTVCPAKYRLCSSRPVRTSQVRCATSDAIESPRSANRCVPCTLRAHGTWPQRAFRRRVINEYHNATNAFPRTLVIVRFSSTMIWPPPTQLEGKMDEAKTALAEARRLNPKLSVKWLQSLAPNIPASV